MREMEFTDETIAIWGAGKLGNLLVHKLSPYYRIVVHDADRSKTAKLEQTPNVAVYSAPQDMAEAKAVLIALPKGEVLPCMKMLDGLLVKPILLVNLSTAVMLEDLQSTHFLYARPASMKVIGEADNLLKEDIGHFIVNAQSDADARYLASIFGKIGKVTLTRDESLYRNVNLVAAEEIMLAAGKICHRLKESGLSKEIIQSAILSVARGTLDQFPWSDRDYFHDLVFQKYQGLAEMIHEASHETP
ncbi:hypothetical protein [Geotalea uraniireducens]|nr:hypothetical protein [Geotalea uraniireducens]